MNVRREARQQVIQRVVGGARGDDVIIVEDEVDGVVYGVELVEQRRHEAAHLGGCGARNSADVEPVAPG